jgi:DNA-binding beta-propeller fold protein YncE
MFTIGNDGMPNMTDNTIIGSEFPERTDPAALVIGPTGVAFDPTSGNLFVADSLDNRIAEIPNALLRSDSAKTGSTLSLGGALNDPLGMSFVSNRLFVTNGNDGNLIEFASQTGQQLDVELVDSSGGPPPGAGALFGLWAVDTGTVYFVDDATNTFELLH